jgi:hypothetical protein
VECGQEVGGGEWDGGCGAHLRGWDEEVLWCVGLFSVVNTMLAEKQSRRNERRQRGCHARRRGGNA